MSGSKGLGIRSTDTISKTKGQELYEIWLSRLAEHSLLSFPEWKSIPGDLKLVWETSAGRFLELHSS
jgi:hypothetical protein